MAATRNGITVAQRVMAACNGAAFAGGVLRIGLSILFALIA
jgi:hypothetical protein